MTFFGDGFDGLCCGGICNTRPAPASFQGGWWGAAIWQGGCYLTRLPSFVTDPDWLEIPLDDAGNELPYKWRVYHTSRHVLLDDIESGGVTYRCVGVAGSQYGDGSWMVPATSSVVWYQLHYAPLDDLATTTPRAGLACLKVGNHSPSGQESDPDNHEATLLGAWLVNKEDGSPEYWNAPEKLCHYYSNNHDSTGTGRKTLVGPGAFAFQHVHIDGGDGYKLVYYSVNQATPTVVTWTLDVAGTDATWKPMFFAASSFPMGLFTRVSELNYYASGTLQSVGRYYRISKALLPGVTPDSSNPAFNKLSLDGFWSGEDEPAAPGDPDYTIALSDTAFYILDCDFCGRYTPAAEVPGGATLHLDAGPDGGFFPVNEWYNGINVDAFFPEDWTPAGTNYRLGAAVIGVSRSDGGNLGFDGLLSGGVKPNWRVVTPITAGVGESASEGEPFGGEDTEDAPWRANDRTIYRVFSSRHNRWRQREGYFETSVGALFVTSDGGLIANPSEGTQTMVAGTANLGMHSVVQVAPENFFGRPPFDPGATPSHLAQLVVTGASESITVGDGGTLPVVFLDYAGNGIDENAEPVDVTDWNDSSLETSVSGRKANAWFWHQSSEGLWAPLWRRRQDGKLLANRVYAGWYYDEEGALQQTGTLAYDGSLDMHESWSTANSG